MLCRELDTIELDNGQMRQDSEQRGWSASSTATDHGQRAVGWTLCSEQERLDSGQGEGWLFREQERLYAQRAG